MTAKFYSIEWKKSDVEFVERKPNEKKPSNAREVRRKPDGTILYMIPKKNQYIITVQAQNGKLYTEDVYGIIKYYKSDVRITKNFRIKFEEYMRTREYVIDNIGFIKGIYSSIEAFFSEET